MSPREGKESGKKVRESGVEPGALLKQHVANLRPEQVYKLPQIPIRLNKAMIQRKYKEIERDIKIKKDFTGLKKRMHSLEVDALGGLDFLKNFYMEQVNKEMEEK